jgi:acetyltransferase
MSVRNLDRMFQPRSIAVIGASDKPKSVGSALMANLLQAGFSGPILPVNPRASAVHGIRAYKDVASLPVAPDLAVIATPPDTVPPLVAELGSRGTRAAVVLTAGFAEGRSRLAGNEAPSCSMPRAPICCVLSAPTVLARRPGIGLNATFAPATLLPGHIVLTSRAPCTTA